MLAEATAGGQWPPTNPSWLLDTGEHGTDILAYAPVAVADEFRQTIVDFLETV